MREKTINYIFYYPFFQILKFKFQQLKFVPKTY